METEKNNIPEHDNKPAEDNRRLKTKWMKEIIWTVAVLAVLMFVVKIERPEAASEDTPEMLINHENDAASPAAEAEAAPKEEINDEAEEAQTELKKEKTDSIVQILEEEQDDGVKVKPEETPEQTAPAPVPEHTPASPITEPTPEPRPSSPQE